MYLNEKPLYVIIWFKTFLRKSAASAGNKKAKQETNHINPPFFPNFAPYDFKEPNKANYLPT